MKHDDQNARMWSIGCRDVLRRMLRDQTEGQAVIRHWPAGRPPSARALELERPFAIWVGFDAWRGFGLRRRRTLREYDGGQRILCLDGDPTREELELLLREGFLTVVDHPPEDGAVRAAFAQALESRHIAQDILSMADEIILEREMLERKNAQLDCINRLISRVNTSLDPAAILAGARKELSRLLPVRMLLGVFWPAALTTAEGDAHPPEHSTARGNSVIELFLPPGLTGQARKEWTALLLKSAARLSGRGASLHAVIDAPGCAATLRRSLHPAKNRVLMLPLSGGHGHFGCAAIRTHGECRLGKDQVDLLHTAVRHLGLALQNAFLFRRLRDQADLDGLTGVHNRRHFDQRLEEEVARHRRFGQPLSLLMADLDHFKRINDTYGHQAGDTALRATGTLLRHTVRSTDHAARYGGEEFAVLLPHTDRTQAGILAERLRAGMDTMDLEENGVPFSVSCSIGIACLEAGADGDGAGLIRAADRALYEAKALGRNTVCCIEGSAGACPLGAARCLGT